MSTNENDGSEASSSSGDVVTSQPRMEYFMVEAKQIFPLSLVFVGMVTFNILCQDSVERSFYNVSRSLTIVFNVLFSQLILGIPTSCKTLCCLAIIIGGFLLGLNGDFSLTGTILPSVFSFVSLNSVFTKKVLSVVDDDHWKLIYYNSVNASILFIPIMVVFDGLKLFIVGAQGLTSPTFWLEISVQGLLVFFIRIATVLQIKATSPLTDNISGTAKAVVLSLIYHLWINRRSRLGGSNVYYVAVLGGSLLYTFVKIREYSQSVLPPPPPPPQQEMTALL